MFVQSLFRRSDPVATVSGTGIRDEFVEVLDEKGVKTVVKCGEKNFDALIQASKDECDIYNILTRVTRGEVDLLNVANGAYVDLTQIPTNLHEAHRQVQHAVALFDRMPLEVKKQFNNDSHTFLAAVGTPEFTKYFADYNAKLNPPAPRASEGE